MISNTEGNSIQTRILCTLVTEDTDAMYLRKSVAWKDGKVICRKRVEFFKLFVCLIAVEVNERKSESYALNAIIAVRPHRIWYFLLGVDFTHTHRYSCFYPTQIDVWLIFILILIWAEIEIGNFHKICDFTRIHRTAVAMIYLIPTDFSAIIFSSMDFLST